MKTVKTLQIKKVQQHFILISGNQRFTKTILLLKFIGHQNIGKIILIFLFNYLYGKIVQDKLKIFFFKVVVIFTKLILTSEN